MEASDKKSRFEASGRKSPLDSPMKSELVITQSPAQNKSKAKLSNRSKRMCQDAFIESQKFNFENRRTQVSNIGEAAYAKVERIIKPGVKNVFNFRIVDSDSMDIHIGVESSLGGTDPHVQSASRETYEWRFQL